MTANYPPFSVRADADLKPLHRSVESGTTLDRPRNTELPLAEIQHLQLAAFSSDIPTYDTQCAAVDLGED